MTTSVAHPLRPSMKRLILIFVALFLLVPLMGLLAVWQETPWLEQNAYTQLSSIAQLKTRQIESWLDERAGDGYTLVEDPDFVRLASEAFDENQNDALTSLRLRLHNVLIAYHYDAISIIDNKTGSVLQVTKNETEPISHPLPPDLTPKPEHSRTGTPVDTGSSTPPSQATNHVHYYLFEDRPRIDFTLPVTASTSGAGPFATLVLHMSPDNFLFPYSSSLIPASDSAETLLVMQSGEDVVFLTPLRHHQAAPGTLSHRLNDPALPAAVALHNDAKGTFEGKDYRGVDVLAAFQPVGDTGWRLIAKLDHDEVMAPLYTLINWVSVVTLTAVTLIGVLFVRLWRQQQHLHDLSVETERHKADKLFRQFFDMPFIGIAITSAQSKRWLRFNDRLCDMLGYQRKELAEMNWAELTHPDDLTADESEFERVMRNEIDGYSMDKRFVRKDGSLMYAYIDIKCVRDADGNVDYFVAMVQDISERKQAELALVQARQLAQKYLDVAAVMIIALDSQGRVQIANRRGCEMLGYSEQELLGINWFDHCLPEHARDFVKMIFGKLMAGDIEPIEYAENAIITRAGEERLIAWHNTVLRDEHDKITGILTSGTDITEQHAAQQALESSEGRLRTLVQTIPDVVWLKDSNGVYLACNATAERVFGASEAEIVGKTDYDFVDKKQAESFREHDRKAIAAGKPSTNEETLTFASDGYQGRFETTKAPMYDSQGELIGVLGIAHDITERERDTQRIESLTRLYATLSQTNQAIVHSKDEAELYQLVCSSAVDFGRVKMAWIGLIDNDTGLVTPVASYGKGTNYLENARITIDPDSPNGRGPVGTAIRQEQAYWCQDFLGSDNTRPWHEQAREAGYAASASLPIWRNGKVVGCFSLYTEQINAFDEASRELLEEMVSDIGFALDNFDKDAHRREIEQRLDLVIAGSSDAPWDWDLVNDQLYYSPQWWQMFGYEVDEVPGDSSLWRQLCHEDDLSQVEEVLQRVMQPGHERDSVECRFRHKDGHYIPVLIRGIISRNESGNPVRLTGSVMDLTAQKETENRLREQLDELNRWFKATIGREERLIELKREINTLLQQQQKPPRYPNADSNKAAGNKEA